MTRTVLALFAACLASAQVTINSSWPRLYSPGQLSYLQRLKTGSAEQKAQLTALKNWIATYDTGTPASKDKADLIQHLIEAKAVAYLADPTASHGGGTYGTSACADLDYLTASSPRYNHENIWTASGAAALNKTRWIGGPVMRGIGAVFNQCTAAQQTNIIRWLQAVKDTHHVTASNRYSPGDNPYWYHGNLNMSQVVLSVAATIMLYDPATRPEAATWLNEEWNHIKAQSPHFNDSVVAAPNRGFAAHGFWQEGLEYAPEGKLMFFDALDYIASSTSETNPWEVFSGLVDDILNYQIHSGSSHRGANRQYAAMPWDDQQHAAAFWTPDTDLMYRVLWYYSNIQPDANRAGYVRQWLSMYPPYPGGAALVARYGVPGATVDYRTVPGFPTDFVAPQANWTTRTDWTANGTWLSFNGGSVENIDHAHGDVATFQLWRKGQWLMRENPGYGNVLTHWHAGGIITNYHGSNSNNRPRGTGYVTENANMDRAVCNTEYCYGLSNATNLYVFNTGYYISPDVETVKRQAFWIKPAEMLILADYVKYVPGLNTHTSVVFTTMEMPTLGPGNTVVANSGDQKVTTTIVRPQNAVLRAVDTTKNRVMGYHKWSNDTVDLYFDEMTNADDNVLAITGATGAFKPLNRMFTYPLEFHNNANATQDEPYKNGASYNVERLRLSIPGSNWAESLPEEWDPRQNIISQKAQNLNDQPDFRFDVTSPTRHNSITHLFVIDPNDAAAAPAEVKDRSVAGMDAAQFTKNSQSYFVGAVNPDAPQLPLTASYEGSPTVYILGLAPSTTYVVSGETTGTFTVATEGGGTSVTTDSTGVLTFAASGTSTLPMTVRKRTAETLVVGKPFSMTLATNDAVGSVSWGVTGSLPEGVTHTSGTLSGIPTTPGTYALTLSASDKRMTVPAEVMLQVDAAPTVTPYIVNPSFDFYKRLNDSVPATTVTRAISAFGGQCTVGAATHNASWFTVALAPGTVGNGTTKDFSVSVSFADAVPGTQYTGLVTIPCTGGGDMTARVQLAVSDIQITSAGPANAVTGQAYSHRFVAEKSIGNLGWDVASGTLPPGMSFNPYFQTLSGTPTTPGTYTFTIRAYEMGHGAIAQATQTVTMEVLNTGVWAAAAPASLSFSATQGGANPPDQTTTVSASGGPCSVDAISENAAWLTGTITGGVGAAPKTISAAVNVSGLSAGSYNGTLSVTCTGAVNSPLSVPVSLTVNAGEPQTPFQKLKKQGRISVGGNVGYR